MPDRAEAVAKKLAWELGSWRSIELRISEDFVNYDPRRPPDHPRTFHAVYRYIETAADQRMYEYRMDSDNDPGTSIGIEYSDGTKCAQLLRNDTKDQPSQEQVAIKRHFGLENSGVAYRPGPLKFLYVGLKPLPEVLPGANFVGEGRWLGRDCDRFLFGKVQSEGDPILHVYWLDRETGMTIRYEYFNNQQEWSREAPDWVWNAKSLDTIDGHHLTLKSEFIMYNIKSTDPKSLLNRHDDTVDEVAFDRDYPASTFWPAITERTSVFDYIENKVAFPKKPAQRATSTVAPVQAVEPTGWGASSSTAALLLGATALGVGFFLHRRRG